MSLLLTSIRNLSDSVIYLVFKFGTLCRIIFMHDTAIPGVNFAISDRFEVLEFSVIFAYPKVRRIFGDHYSVSQTMPYYPRQVVLRIPTIPTNSLIIL